MFVLILLVFEIVQQLYFINDEACILQKLQTGFVVLLPW